MTSESSANSRFRRAIDTCNVRVALAAAADLPHVGLTDALELLLLDFEPAAFDAHGWHVHIHSSRHRRSGRLQ